ncbi:MAG TPA: peroxidase family protein [Pirellulales bacterium]|nr:peroxidase family protein [Pirellulales bacterium]
MSNFRISLDLPTTHAALLGFTVGALLAFSPFALLAEDRSYDGTGNNIANPTWGAAGTDFIRNAPAAYGDGYSTPSGADRPNPRFISNTVVAQTGSIPNNMGLSDMVFQWGQFIDHDMDLTNLNTTPVEEFDIPIPQGDPTFDPGNTGTQVMQFQRSQYDPATGTGPGNPRQQVNSITSFLDASMVYGSDATRAMALRTGVGGQLKTSAGNLLPLNTMDIDNADNGDPDYQDYYVAGDVRVNEQVGLTAIQTLFVREHNRQAGLIAAANPGWSDEQIYQEARKIVGAEIQSITFREFLPALLGSAAPSVTSTYHANVNPSISDEWATAFFRFGHSMLSPQLLRIQNDGTPAPGGPLSLQDAFFQHQNMSSPNQLDYILKGLAVDTQQEIDAHIVDGVRNFLFGEPIPGIGEDLASLNIQRGRDNGLPDYNTLRVAFGLPAYASFNQITSNPQTQAALRAAYGTTGGQDNINLVDPWVGALAEDHLPGMDVGPLIAASLIDQFTRVRDGDRFWFDNGLNVAGLTSDEMDFVSNVTLSEIIEDNTGLTNLQSDVFLAAVPEPSAFVLAALGCAGLAWCTRGRMTPFRKPSC